MFNEYTNYRRFLFLYLIVSRISSSVKNGRQSVGFSHDQLPNSPWKDRDSPDQKTPDPSSGCSVTTSSNNVRVADGIASVSRGGDRNPSASLPYYTGFYTPGIWNRSTLGTGDRKNNASVSEGWNRTSWGSGNRTNSVAVSGGPNPSAIGSVDRINSTSVSGSWNRSPTPFGLECSNGSALAESKKISGYEME